MGTFNLIVVIALIKRSFHRSIIQINCSPEVQLHLVLPFFTILYATINLYFPFNVSMRRQILKIPSVMKLAAQLQVVVVATGTPFYDLFLSWI